MVYEIAGLRIDIQNKYDYTTKFCRDYLSSDISSPIDFSVSVTDAEIEEERKHSPGFSDGYLENICLYRRLCTEATLHGRILLHASVLSYEGKAYAFLGRSGTGKSTHTRLWLKYLEGVKIVNGDKPILRKTEDGFMACGTPWRGKESWGENTFAPLSGLCFLEQAKENSISRLSPSETVKRLMVQMLLPSDEEKAMATLELADELIQSVPAYLLRCDISETAVKTSFETLTGKDYHKELI